MMLTMINKTAEFVHQKMSGECTGHDWWHVRRVWNLARYIQEKEGGDSVVIELAALLHDIEDWKFTKEKNSNVGARVAYDWVKKINVDEERALHIFDIIESISFKGAGEKNKIKTLEGKIVQDADRLDA